MTTVELRDGEQRTRAQGRSPCVCGGTFLVEYTRREGAITASLYCSKCHKMPPRPARLWSCGMFSRTFEEAAPVSPPTV